jgi:hypothetical protein
MQVMEQQIEVVAEEERVVLVVNIVEAAPEDQAL